MTLNGSNGNAAELQWLPTLTVDGIGTLGNFDKFSGGDSSAKPNKYRPGGMGPQISYPSLPVYSDVTISRVYDQGRDQALIALLHTVVGAVYGTLALQPLDASGNPWGVPRVYRGRVADIKDGMTDSNSDKPRIWELVLSVETIGS